MNTIPAASAPVDISFERQPSKGMSSCMWSIPDVFLFKMFNLAGKRTVATRQRHGYCHTGCLRHSAAGRLGIQQVRLCYTQQGRSLAVTQALTASQIDTEDSSSSRRPSQFELQKFRHSSFYDEMSCIASCMTVARPTFFIQTIGRNRDRHQHFNLTSHGHFTLQ